MIALTQSNYLCEFEIKISRTDFKNDFKNKPIKHIILGGELLCNNKNCAPTSYFNYAVPEGLIGAEEVPDYAGLIYITPLHRCKIIKPAPKLSKEKITLEQENGIMRGCCFRMWNMIIGEK